MTGSEWENSRGIKSHLPECVIDKLYESEWCPGGWRVQVVIFTCGAWLFRITAWMNELS